MRRAYWHLYHRYKDAPVTASALAASLIILATPACHKAADNDEAKIAAEVRTEFLHAWHNYEQYAWGHDALRPLSKSAHDWYGQSLQMTPVDALDTLLLMHLDSEAAKVLQLVGRDLSFDCDIYVNMARENGVAITHILETHIHADLVSGSRELCARLDSAKIFGSLHRYAQICAEQSIEAVHPKYLTSEHRAEISREGMCNLSHCYRAI